MFIFTVKRHIKAKTEKALERLMLVNNIKRNAFHHYDIIWNGKEYVAWFIAENNHGEDIKEVFGNKQAGEV